VHEGERQADKMAQPHDVVVVGKYLPRMDSVLENLKEETAADMINIAQEERDVEGLDDAEERELPKEVDEKDEEKDEGEDEDEEKPTRKVAHSDDIPTVEFRDVVLAKKFGTSPYDSDRYGFGAVLLPFKNSTSAAVWKINYNCTAFLAFISFPVN
jgi:hypothetical protein